MLAVTGYKLLFLGEKHSRSLLSFSYDHSRRNSNLLFYNSGEHVKFSRSLKSLVTQKRKKNAKLRVWSNGNEIGEESRKEIHKNLRYLLQPLLLTSLCNKAATGSRLDDENMYAVFYNYLFPRIALTERKTTVSGFQPRANSP